MSENPSTIVVIEDEAQMRRFLRASLSSNGYRVIEAETGQDGLNLVAAHSPDLILLDLGLPDLDGLVVTERLREWSKTPIIVISARGREEDKIHALDLGADDYLTKPFGVGELLARIRVALRHAVAGADGSSLFTVGELKVDLNRRQVFCDEKEVHLTPIEYRILAMLVKHSGKVITHRQLLREVWGPNFGDQTQYLRVYMGQLRHKLEREPSRPRYLVTEPGVGYRLRDRIDG
ncbi:MAG: response regulator [Polyangiaceae bacterium]|nr:response regulator [Polyangiaceae bacterium]